MFRVMTVVDIIDPLLNQKSRCTFDHCGIIQKVEIHRICKGKAGLASHTVFNFTRDLLCTVVHLNQSCRFGSAVVQITHDSPSGNGLSLIDCLPRLGQLHPMQGVRVSCIENRSIVLADGPHAFSRSAHIGQAGSSCTGESPSPAC